MYTSVVRFLMRAAFFGVLAVFGCTVFSGCKKPQPVQEIRPVRIVTVTPKERKEVQTLTGSIAAHRFISVSFKISGRLAARNASVGNFVTAGKPLAVLSDEIERNSLIAAEAEMASAKAAYEQTESMQKRAVVLIQTKAISQNEFDEANRQFKSASALVQAAEAKAKNAREQLGYTTLKAPVDGLITDKYAEIGEVVAAGRPVFRIAEKNILDAVFDVPADYLKKGLAIGREIQVCPEENSEKCPAAQLYEIAPDADPVTRTYLAKAVFRQSEQAALLGSTVYGRIEISARLVTEIPSSALSSSDKQPAVWVVNPSDTTVSLRPVTVERYTTNAMIINSGLSQGEQVVSAGVQALHQGQKVKIQDDGHEQH